MSLNNVTGTTYSSALLIADTFTLPNGSNDSLPPFTRVNGFPVSAALEINSTLGALLLSRMTTTQRDRLNAADGMIIYNTTAGLFQIREGGNWKGIPAVIIPTVVNDIPIFSDTAGTMIDSGVSLLFSLNVGMGTFNYFQGRLAGNLGLTGTNNVADGVAVLTSLTTGTLDAAFGYNILVNLTTGQRNTGLGTSILSTSITGNDNVGSGHSVLNGLSVSTGSRNVAMGNNTLDRLSDLVNAFDNSAFGHNGFALATSVLRSCAFGSGAGALRASYINCTLGGYNCDNSGLFTGTTGYGSGVILGGNNACSYGFNAQALGISAIALGQNTIANGDYAVSICSGSQAQVAESIAFGLGCSAGGTGSIAFGNGSAANANGALALGNNAAAHGLNSVALGQDSVANADNSIVLGTATSLIGIAISSPIANLHINGTVAFAAPVVVPNGSFPYTALATDFIITCYPTGALNVVILPTVSAANLGRAFKISNGSTSNLDQLTIETASGQTVSSPSLGSEQGGTFVAVDEGGTFKYRVALGC